MYTPQFSNRATVTVRRLAWALSLSMPKAVDQVINALPSVFSPGTVCLACKDQTKCELCAFSQQPAAVPAALAV
jgi:recombinational DNA repair protein RecR